MPSAANTKKVRYLLWVRWRSGATMETPVKYHGHVSIGPAGDVPPRIVHLGRRDHYPKATVEIHGDEIPAIALIDTDTHPAATA